ncbi:preQ(1) synthase [Candidatus Peregrinibacteria bacterium]|nr:preQ(1) synthase [Candidatus Peregrinibacteria bacterium]
MNTSKYLYEEGKDYQQIDAKVIRDRLKKVAPLMAFEFQEQVKESEHWITIESPEFTAICPFSDYPDFGMIRIGYVPNKRCLELKSFKLYINAFRDIRIFHETVTEIIFADFLQAIQPKKAKIEVDMNPRGNVKTICRKFYKCS